MKNNIFLVASLVVLLTLILIPILAYIWNFSKSEISPDPQMWGVTGDYFGGVLNPIISLASLCVLSYLTYLVAQQTNKESKKLFILERRMIAYDEIAKFVKSINSFVPKMGLTISMIPTYEKLPPEHGVQQMLKTYEELRDLSAVFMNFYFTLSEFNLRYGHLFKYNFHSKEYKDLLAESKRVSEMMSNLVSDHKSILLLPEEDRTLKLFQELLFPVFVKLRSEVETKL